MGRLSRRSLGRRTKRVLEEAHCSRAELEDAWLRESLKSLSDEDLDLLYETTSPEREGTLLSPAEQAALERFEEAFEQVQVRWGA